ncbi:MAG: lipid II:glycine glycyltransferase FemX [Carbonactinosporaceae bacterium]
MSLRVRPLSRDQHVAFLTSRASASFLQFPSWAEVKSEWSAESLGWVDGSGKTVGAALVLYRQVPHMQRFFAYLPEGPVIDWNDHDLGRWLTPLVEHLRAKGAFSAKMGPPVAVRRWEAATVKRAIAAKSAARLRDVPPDWTNERALEIARQLKALGWLHDDAPSDGFGDVQPRYVFHVPLIGRNLDDLRAGFNQLWRRNIKKAQRAGVEVVHGDIDDLPTFHELYVETARRDRFTPRPLPYFQRMWQALNAESPDRMRLYLAVHEGDVLAATISVTVGEHVWYTYGATSMAKPETRPSNAVQWRMIRDAYAVGASVYDLRGIGDVLDENDHLFGLIQFKLGTGGYAMEYLGEWDLPLNRLLHKAFDLYMSRR